MSEHAKLPVSVFIIARNEADRIHYPILSVRDWAAEIIVVDSGSDDGTPERARELGASRVEHHEWQGYGPQKRYAQSLCSQPWVLNLDADEAVPPELQREIAFMFRDVPPAPAIYALDIRMVLPGEHRPRPMAPNNIVKRLYPRDLAIFKDSPVHDTVVPVGDALPVKRLREPVYHYCFRSYQHMIDKIIGYSEMQALDKVARGKRIGPLRIALEPFYAFIKSYLLRRYFLMGSAGVAYSVFYVFGRTLRNVKWLEKQKAS